MVLPKKIQEIVGNRHYVSDSVGMSGYGIYLYEDMVLKIQKTDQQSKNEVMMLQ